MKFNTHHFPAGTIVVLEDDIYSHTTSKIPGEEFEITKIVRTGPKDYVLETTSKSNPETFGDMNEAFHMTCVKTIVKRGDGPVVFHERDFDPLDFRFLEEKHILGDYLNVKIKKTHFAHWSLRVILMFCINDRPASASTLDMETMLAAVEKQSFVKTIDRNGRGFGYVSVDKKRLKRFIKQNYNRFLLNVQKAQKEQDKMYAEMDERAFNAVIEAAKVVDDPGFIPETGMMYRASEDDAKDEKRTRCPLDMEFQMSPWSDDIFKSEVESGPVVDAIRDETYRLFKESEKLLTDSPILDEMMKGGIPAGQMAIFSSPRPVQGKTMLEQDLAKKLRGDYKYVVKPNIAVMSNPPVTENGVAIPYKEPDKDQMKKHEEDM